MPHTLKQLLNDPLYKNSVFLILSRALNMASGFFFWVIAAKLYSIKDVGVATAIKSSVGLVILLSRFGFDFSLIRYAPNNDKSKVFNTCFLITSVLTVVISIFYIIFIYVLDLNLIPNYYVFCIFVIFALSESVFLISGNMFWSLRKANHYFVQNIFLSLRILLLVFLIQFKQFGIVTSMCFSNLLASVYALVVLRKYVKIDFKFDKGFIKRSFKFSFGNFLSNNLFEAPALILPIMVLHWLGNDQAAKYYIAFMIGNLTFIVPSALSTSLFVEGSHDQPLKENAKKAILALTIFLIPTMVAIILFGKTLLNFLDKEYVDAFYLLKLFILTGFFASIHMIYISIQNVRLKVDSILRINLLRFVLLIPLSYILMSIHNINGIGYAWFITHFILFILILIQSKKEGWLQAGSRGQNLDG